MKLTFHIKLILVVLLFSLKGLTAQNLSAPNATKAVQTKYTKYDKQDNIFVFCAPEELLDSLDIELQAISPLGSSPYTFIWYNYDEESYAFNMIKAEVLDSDTSILVLNRSGLYAVQFIDSLNNNETIFEKAWVFVNDPIVEIDTVSSQDIEPFNLSGNFNADAQGNSQPNDFKYYEPDTALFTISETTQIELCFSIQHDTVAHLGFYLETPDSSVVLELLPSIHRWNEITDFNSDTLGCENFDTACVAGSGFNNFCFSSSDTVIPCLCEMDSYPASGSYAIVGDWSDIYGFDPAKDGWQFKILDCNSDYEGTLSSVELTFTDTVNGEIVQYMHKKDNVGETISSSITCLVNTAHNYRIPSFRSDTITLNNPYNFVWRSSPFVVIPDSIISLKPLIDPYPVLKTRFSLTVTDTLGCVFTDTLIFTPASSKIELNDVFAPNALNEQFRVFQLKEAELIRQFNIRIYNRFGQLVYETDDPYFKWDGTRNGEGNIPLPAGTYFYIIQAVGWDNKTDYFLDAGNSEDDQNQTISAEQSRKDQRRSKHITQKGTIYLYR